MKEAIDVNGFGGFTEWGGGMPLPRLACGAGARASRIRRRRRPAPTPARRTVILVTRAAARRLL